MSVSVRMSGRIAVVTIANPPVNALGREVREGLLQLAEKLDADDGVDGVVVTGEGRLFVGGADISEFDRPPEAPHLPDVIARIEVAAKPWAAAVNGLALGGGTELALGCRFRVASEGAVFSLPETSLGLVPGAGGTQRLPRLIGIDAAIPVVTAGQTLDARKAQELGLVDAVLEGPLAETAARFLTEALTGPLPAPASERKLDDPGEAAWDAAGARVAKAARGVAAPLRALSAMRRGAAEGFAAGLAEERATFLELRASDEARALRRLFFAERAATKPAALRGVDPRPVRTVGVIGGGTMGIGIAAALRNAGCPVVLSERDAPALDRALAGLGAIFDAQVRRGMHDAAGAGSRMDGVTGTVGLDALAGCDLVIEAVFEDLAVKREVFGRLAGICGRGAILATNTSYLDPRDIFAGLDGGDRFIGLHFFSPAQVMKLIEIVPLPGTAPDVVAAAFELARRLRKVPVRSGICEGFIGNRILRRTRAETEAMLKEGIPFADIDAAMRGFGYGMGPFEMQDLAGLDIAFLMREAQRKRGEDVPDVAADILVRAGRKGQKTGGGWYDYAAGDRTPRPSEEVDRLLAGYAGPPRKVGPDEIVARLLAAMRDEGEAILQEGIADSPEAIDLVLVHGYGFPRHRGGPMFGGVAPSGGV